ncbi:hypothetical protein L596_008699 [Steinernema carpocapsae]|uniref:EGF-like domain-containing protein n=1 Tax=Steinernema carpocapsae TaxID=34508 RepID=A0A4U5PDK1_STECR|nr:hypothetical protein L596_008699 [Steinernema carpocapsae]
MCADGYTGAKCENNCPEGRFGPKCSGKCVDCADRESCNLITGECSKCPPGMMGILCEQSCLAGTWGEGCKETCDCALGHACNNVDGTCECSTGHAGKKCEDECPAGTWGSKCSQKCRACKNNGICSPINGECQCPPGFQGESCQMRCSVGQWGTDCMNNCTCASDRKQCDPVNGHCQCASGLQGNLCQDYCELGFWGPDCINQCKCKSLSSTCSATTGECTCKPGYFGEVCDKICPEGQFGDYCKQSCGECDEGMICDPVVGCCLEGESFCGIARAEFVKASRGGVAWWPFLLLAFTVILFAFGFVAYYRSKWLKEKDPDLPTVTFHPEHQGFAVDEPDHNEFNNPLYNRKSVVDGGPAKTEKDLEALKLGPRVNLRPQNEYESLDQFQDIPSTSSATSECRQPLLSSDERRPASGDSEENHDYEVPDYKRKSQESDDRPGNLYS